MFIVYILYSHSLQKFYTGFTADLEQRMGFHNADANTFTKKGIPWAVVASFECPDKTAAMLLEKQIKKNGAQRYLERNNISFSLNGGRQFSRRGVMATPTKTGKSLVEIQSFFYAGMFVVYILYSHSLQKFYTGFTADLEQRMAFHNAGANTFTKKGIPWVVVGRFECPDKTAAMLLEKQIKKNGAQRYLERNNISFSL